MLWKRRRRKSRSWFRSRCADVWRTSQVERPSKEMELDEWVIMPNHLHGIVIINNNTGGFHHIDRCWTLGKLLLLLRRQQDFFIDVQQTKSFVRLMMERKKREVLVGTMCTLVARYNNGENKVKSLQLQCLLEQCETLIKLFFDNAQKRHICFPCTAITATFCAASFMNQAEFFPFCDLQLKIAKFQTRQNFHFYSIR